MKIKNKKIKTKNLKYFEYFRIGFKKSIEYKSYLIGTLVTPLFMGIFFYFIWSYIFQVKSGGVSGYLIGGFTFSEMILYLIIGLLIQTAKSTEIAQKISETIKSGDIATYLCRPVNFVKSLLFDSFGEKIIPFSMFAVLLVVMTKILGLNFPALPIIIIFIIYGILLIFFQIVLDIIIGGFSFWLTEIWGVQSSISQVLWILSGRALPLSLFPTMFQSILAFTPFLYLEYTFASIYLGKIELLQAIKYMGIFSIWIVIFIIIMILVYKRGFKKLEAFGG